MKLLRMFLQLGATCLLVLPGPLCAQTAAKSPTPLQASVGEVTDNRSTGSFFSECKVEVKFAGDAAADAASVRRVRVIEATDEAKKKEIEAQQKADGDAAEKIGAAFGEVFKGMFGGMMSSNSKDAIQLYIKDPEKRVLGLEFQDAQGKPLATRGGWTSEQFKQTDLASPPPADTQLVIQLAVPEAVKTYPFELKDIALP